MIDFIDRSEEAETGRILRDQAVALLALAMLELRNACELVRGACSDTGNTSQRMVSHREAGRCLKRLDDLLREADDCDSDYVRTSAVVLMLKNEVVGLRSKLRAGVP